MKQPKLIIGINHHIVSFRIQYFKNLDRLKSDPIDPILLPLHDSNIPAFKKEN